MISLLVLHLSKSSAQTFIEGRLNPALPSATGNPMAPLSLNSSVSAIFFNCL